MGERVTRRGDDSLEYLTIPGQTYAQVLAGPEKFPDQLTKGWERVSAATDAQLGGKRTWKVDFEITITPPPPRPRTTATTLIFVGVDRPM